MERTAIYALHDPRDWSIRYVGKANDPERRHSKQRSHNRLLQRFLSELRALGLKPRVTILQTCSAEDWQKWERFWIATVKAAGENLLNLHPGGDRPLEAKPWNKGLKMSEEQRARIVFPNPTREQRIASRLGKKDSQETKLKKSLAARGRKKTPVEIEKIAAANRGLKRSEETKSKISAAKLGTKQSPERVSKRIDSGFFETREYREKMKRAFLGRKRDPISKKWLPLAAPQEV